MLFRFFPTKQQKTPRYTKRKWKFQQNWKESVKEIWWNSEIWWITIKTFKSFSHPHSFDHIFVSMFSASYFSMEAKSTKAPMVRWPGNFCLKQKDRRVAKASAVRHPDKVKTKWNLDEVTKIYRVKMLWNTKQWRETIHNPQKFTAISHLKA